MSPRSEAGARLGLGISGVTCLSLPSFVFYPFVRVCLGAPKHACVYAPGRQYTHWMSTCLPQDYTASVSHPTTLQQSLLASLVLWLLLPPICGNDMLSPGPAALGQLESCHQLVVHDPGFVTVPQLELWGHLGRVCCKHTW